MYASKTVSLALGILVVVLAALLWHYYSAYELVSNISVSQEKTAPNIFQVASSSGEVYLTVGSNGKVGIDTLIPQTELDVHGLVRVYTASTTACTKSIEGAIAYDPKYGHFYGCNSFEWRRLDE